MEVDQDISMYLSAAQLAHIPMDLSKPRHNWSKVSEEQRRKKCADCITATRIWNLADTDEDRKSELNKLMLRGHCDGLVFEVMKMFLQGPKNRLPLSEIESLVDRFGLKLKNNPLLSKSERESLDRHGYVDLGPLISDEQLLKMRQRYDNTIRLEGTRAGNAENKGIARLVDTVVKPMNRDGLLDPIFSHPRLLAAVRHILGTQFKNIGSNYHCALPGYGYQGIHADFMWGVAGEPQVVNAIWLIDDFTKDNGATRVVPGSHLSGIHPTGDLVGGKPRNLNKSVEGEVQLIGSAGRCFVYNAHLWHGGTQNCTHKLRRAQHAFFSRTTRPSSTDVPNVIDSQVYERLNKDQRTILDIP